MSNPDKLIHHHNFATSNTMHGGFLVSTSFYDNGGGECYSVQELILFANCNEAKFILGDGAKLTPANLRRMADELENATVEAGVRLETTKSEVA